MRGWLINSLVTGGPVLPSWRTPSPKPHGLLLCLTAAVAAVLRRSAAAVRDIGCGALTSFGLIVLPLLSWLLPGWARADSSRNGGVARFAGLPGC